MFRRSDNRARVILNPQTGESHSAHVPPKMRHGKTAWKRILATGVGSCVEFPFFRRVPPLDANGICMILWAQICQTQRPMTRLGKIAWKTRELSEELMWLAVMDLPGWRQG
jgi:hypothetical protein